MSRGLMLLLTVIAVAASGFHLVASGTEAVDAVHEGLDAQLLRSRKAFAIAAGAAGQRTLALAAESAQAGALVTAMGELSRKGARPDLPALDAATGAVATRAEKRGEAERAVLLALANRQGAAASRLGEQALLDAPAPPLTDVALDGAGRAAFAVVDGRLQRLAAAPVGGAEKPAGALVLGYAVDDSFATWLAGELGADVTILQGGKVVASSLGPAARSQVASVAGDAGAEPFDLGGRPEGFSFLGIGLPVGGPEVASMRGQVAPLPGVDEARVILSTDAAPALAPVASAQSRGLLVTGLLAVLGLAFSVVVGRTGSPKARIAEVADVAEAIAAGEKGQRAPEGLPGDLGRIADALNRLATRVGLEAELAARSQAAEAAAAKVRASREPTPPPAPAPTPPAPAAEAPTREAEAAPAEGGAPLSWEGFSSTPPPPSPAEPAPPAAAWAPWPDSGEPAGWEKPTRVAPAGEADFSGLLDGAPAPNAAEPPTPPPADPGFGATPESESYNPDATVVAAVPEALLRATSRAPARPVAASPVAVPAADPDEAHFEQVYADFVATRERCGEATDGLTFDRFAAKLRKNREQLVEKYRCRTVRFTVYVKEGKAALKATPVKD